MYQIEFWIQTMTRKFWKMVKIMYALKNALTRAISVCLLLIWCARYSMHCIAITQTKRNINCRSWWCTKFSEKNCDCFVVLIPHDAYHLANKNFFYLQKDLISLNEINHVIVLRIFVLADYADASEKWVIRLTGRTNMYI